MTDHTKETTAALYTFMWTAVLFMILLSDIYFKSFVQSCGKMAVTSVGWGKILWPDVWEQNVLRPAYK